MTDDAPSTDLLPPGREDPTLLNARREGWIIFSAWAAATAYCSIYYALFGYVSRDKTVTAADVNPTFGMPSWFFWGIMVPWVACGVFTAWFVGFVMVEDDLGRDHSAELEEEIREGGTDA